MCIKKKWVRNQFTNRWYYTNCGKCEACLQEKANKRVTRIKNEWLSHNGLTCFFVELDYSNVSVPYILKSDADNFLSDPDKFSLPIYRNNVIIENLVRESFFNRGKLPEFNLLECRSDFIISRLPYFRYIKDKVAVLYKPDIQRFFKRLKINLFRAGYNGYFSYFYCSDYGGKYKRCHFHALIYFESRFYSLIYNTICKSWNFSDLSKPRKSENGSTHFRIEVARNPAKYVASYVHRREDVSSLLSDTKPFKPMYHFSNGFGCHYEEFSLAAVLQKIRRGTLYYLERRVRNGVSTESHVLLPKYVLSRYFPKFKGFDRLSPDEIFNVVIQPRKISGFRLRCSLSQSDVMSIIYQLNNLRRRCLDVYKVNLHDWAHCYARVWSLYYALLLSDSWKDVKFVRDVLEHFDNIGDYLAGKVRFGLLDSYEDSCFYGFDPDPMSFNRYVATNISLTREYRKQKHHHNLKNFVNE